MKFTSFKIKNFRGVPAAEIVVNDDSKPICLLGLNESGKTTILQSISTIGKLCQGKQLSDQEILSMRPKGIGFTDTIKLSTNLSLDSEDKESFKKNIKSKSKKVTEFLSKNEITIDFCFEFSNHQIEKKYYKLNNHEIDDNSDVSNKSSKVIQEIFSYFKKLCPEIIYYDDFYFDIPSEITFNDNEISKLTTEKQSNNQNWQHILNDILISVKSKSNFLEDIVSWPSKDHNTVDNRLQQMSNKINTVISKKWTDISKGF